jgi:O-antigen/teichoic acid export membrane protein
VGEASRRLLSQISSTVGVELVSFVCSITFSVLTTRALERAGKGIFSSSLNAIAIAATIASFGLGKAIIYFINQPSLPRGSLMSGLLTFLPVSVGVGVAAAFGLVPGSVQSSGAEFGLVAVVVSATVVIGLQESILRGLREIHAVNFASVTQSVFQLLLVAVLARFSSLDVERVLGIVVATACARLALLMVAIRQRPQLRPQRGDTGKTLRMLLMYGLTYQLYALLWVCHARMDVLMLERLRGADVAGLYATGANLAQLLLRIPNALMLAILPYLAQLKSEQDAVTFAAKSARIVAPVLVGLAALGYVLGGFLIPVLYGENFRRSGLSFEILLPGVVACALHLMISGSFVAAGYLRLQVKNAAIGLAANVVLNYLWLIPRYGDAGAALASAITYTLMLVLTLRDASRITGVGALELLLLRKADFQTLQAALSRRRAVK